MVPVIAVKIERVDNSCTTELIANPAVIDEIIVDPCGIADANVGVVLDR